MQRPRSRSALCRHRPRSRSTATPARGPERSSTSPLRRRSGVRLWWSGRRAPCPDPLWRGVEPSHPSAGKGKWLHARGRAGHVRRCYRFPAAPVTIRRIRRIDVHAGAPRSTDRCPTFEKHARSSLLSVAATETTFGRSDVAAYAGSASLPLLDCRPPRRRGNRAHRRLRSHRRAPANSRCLPRRRRSRRRPGRCIGIAETALEAAPGPTHQELERHQPTFQLTPATPASWLPTALIVRNVRPVSVVVHGCAALFAKSEPRQSST